MIKRLQSAFYKVPYSIERLWVAGALYCKKRPIGMEDCELLPVNRDNGRDSAIVPLLRKNGNTYFYKVVGAYCSQGDDHIISPWSFDFRFHHAETLHPNKDSEND